MAQASTVQKIKETETEIAVLQVQYGYLNENKICNTHLCYHNNIQCQILKIHWIKLMKGVNLMKLRIDHIIKNIKNLNLEDHL